MNDVRESPEVAAAGFAALRLFFADFEALKLRVSESRLVVAPGSQLAEDCAATPYYRMAEQIGHLIVSAEDHLSMLQEFIMREGGSIPAMGGYTLIRSSIEASADAIWLLSGGTRNKRVLNSLKMVVHDRADVDSLSKKLGLNNDAGARRMRAALEEIKNARPGLRQNSLDKYPTQSAILESADRHVQATNYTGLEAWKACSGLAHSNRYAAHMLLEHEHIDGANGESPTLVMRSSAAVLAMMLEAAVNYFSCVVDMYFRASTTSGRGSFVVQRK